MLKNGTKEIGFERLIFFSDAIIAIAITLLALNLKLDVAANEHITFKDLLVPWEKYLAFILSFINIAGFWKNHHYIYTYIKKIDEKLLLINICWLLLIVILPFATTLLSAHFGDTPAIFLYSLIITLLTASQNLMWHYAISKKDFINKAELSSAAQKQFQLMFFLDLANGTIAMVLSFFFPILAFVLLFFKLPILIFMTFYMATLRKKGIPILRERNEE